VFDTIDDEPIERRVFRLTEFTLRLHASQSRNVGATWPLQKDRSLSRLTSNPKRTCRSWRATGRRISPSLSAIVRERMGFAASFKTLNRTVAMSAHGPTLPPIP
jgi:hypothetical protein